MSEPFGDDIELLDKLLGDVLRDREGAALTRLARHLYEEKDGESPNAILDRIADFHDPEKVKTVLRAYTVLFQLLNTAEQKEIVRINRLRQSVAGRRTSPESIAEAVGQLKLQGVTAAQMQTLLNTIEIVPTITAHPTEARRRTVMDKLQQIAYRLAERDAPPELPNLDKPLNTSGLPERELLRTLTALWETNELRTSPVTVQDEVHNGLYFFRHSILDVVTWLRNDLRTSLAEAYPGHTFVIPPFVRYYSWVGGDRDGNPNVTPHITWETLLQHKREVLRNYIRRVDEMQRQLSLSDRLAPPGEEVMRSLLRDTEEIALDPDFLNRSAHEPLSLKLKYISQRLRATSSHLDALVDFRTEGPLFTAQQPAYLGPQEFLADLEIIRASLLRNGIEILANEGDLDALITQVETFGFHLAVLDIRQHSDEHARALDEIMAQARILPPKTLYSSLSEAEKVKLLTRELCQSRPLLGRETENLPMAAGVLQVFEVIRHAQRYISNQSIRAYVISMTHGVSDILEVLLLAKEEGLVRWKTGDGPPRLESDIDVVPLFETIKDLASCHNLMRNLFANRAYKIHLEARDRFQEIMLGYSDSSKDGGYLAANWALHDTQARLAAVCQRAGLRFRLFHGRGGTVGRGGGRANRAILSQPRGSFNGSVRFTEQGEVVAFRYSIPAMAHRHLEQMAGAVLLAAHAGGEVGNPKRAWHNAMNLLAAKSREAYSNFVNDGPEFWSFYTQATPIAHISRLPIASRPVMRKGSQIGLADLRAIPWVFAWVQSRYVLPGWFGLGSGLEAFASRSVKNQKLLQSMYRDWPFFKMVIDNAQVELLRAHLPTAALYAARVRPRELGKRFHTLIETEYNRSSKWILNITGQSQLLDNAKVLRRIIALRNPAVMPLSKLQVALMDHWEKIAATPDEELKNQWRDAILLSITGVAAAMQSTG